MRFEIVTIFPDFFAGFFENGIVRRALAEGLVEARVHDLREFTHDRHRTVDDRPFGGGEGMVLKPEPLAEALASLGIAPGLVSQPCPGAASALPPPQESEERECSAAEELPCPQNPDRLITGHDLTRAANATNETRALAPEDRSSSLAPGTPILPASQGEPQPRPTVILLSAQGRPFTQALARRLALLDRIVLICGRYEGVDERISQLYCDMELSIGDYVLSGGELAAAVVMDAAMRLVPGVLGNEASSEFESFGVADAEIETEVEGVPRSQHGAGGLLDYPHYTRPAEFAGLRAPEVLMNGDHRQIRLWRREQQLRKTLANRPDLLVDAALSKEDRKLLEAIRRQEEAH